MNLVKFPGHNVVFAENQPEYLPLPAHVSPSGVVTCCWKLTEDELERVLVTGVIWHQIHTGGTGLQPQLLSAVKPSMETQS